MGEQAEDLIDGVCCSWCGVYFENSHGHPVLCKACYEEQKYGNDWLPKSTEKEL